MIAVRKSFSFVKESLSSCFVEFSAVFITEGHPSNMEVGILSLFNPISPFSLLETMSRPIPSILRLYDIKLTIETKSHNRVSRMRTSSVHNDLVKSIKTHNSDVITRLDKRGIKVNLYDFSLFHRVLDSVS